jgi:hypothetical protein
MFIWTILLLLFFVLFYFHLVTQYKKPREPFEIYETQYESRQQLDTLNGNRQPFLFKIDDFCPLTYTTTLAELTNDNRCFVSLIDNSKYYGGIHNAIIKMPLKEGLTFISYYPNYNCFANIHAAGGDAGGGSIWNTIIGEFDEILAPSMIPFMCSSQLSIMGGGADGGADDATTTTTTSHTIPEYHTQTAKYVMVLSGEITVKITSVRNYEKLNGGKCKEKRFGNGGGGGTQFTNFIGDVNIWNINTNIKLQKIPFLEFNVGTGYAISIPPFTIWSIQYNTPCTTVFSLDYISFMNSIANIGNWWHSNPFNDVADTDEMAV